MAIRGRILKGIGGFYTVAGEDGARHECRARGRFRLDKITPLAGDYVLFTPQSEESDGFIEEILTRKNMLIRPPVANIDLLIIVLSAAKPKPDLLLADKLILQAELARIPTAICLNKTDAADDTAFADDLKNQYRCYPFLMVSAATGAGMDGLKDMLRGRLSAFTGQSAVGKSSILNVLGESLSLKTGELSKKVSRGKHTTRTSELLELPGLEAFAIDTPGFSIFDALDLEEARLSANYPEFAPYLQDCRFPSCLHANEPDCAVKAAVQEGHIHQKRYERYLELLNFLKEKRSKQYD